MYKCDDLRRPLLASLLALTKTMIISRMTCDEISDEISEEISDDEIIMVFLDGLFW